VAGRILGELRAADDPKRVWERYRSVAELEGFAIKAEDVPPAARVDAFAPEYLDGLFSRPAPGVVDALARTSFGWHAIIVTTIVPGQTTTLEQARATLRRELLSTVREQALQQLVATLTKSHRIEHNEPTIEALLHADADSLGMAAP
jgi:hypothetical protein